MNNRPRRNANAPSPRPTSGQKRELEHLTRLRDEAIDTSDIPELPLTDWRERGIVGKFYRPIKKPVTIRLDADIIAWLKSAGPGYQTKVNGLLRRTMLADLRRAPAPKITRPKTKRRKAGSKP